MIETSKTPLRLAQAHFNRMQLAGATASTRQRTALFNMLRDIDSQIGLSKFTSIYPFIGGTAATHALDVLGSGNDITWSGTVTHDAKGSQSNGSTGYGDTGIASSDYSSADAHLSCYVTGGTASTNRMAVAGVYASGPNNRLGLFSQLASANAQGCIGQNCASTASGGEGFYALKNDGTSVDLYLDGSQIATAAHSASTFTSQTINIMRDPGGNTWYDDSVFKFVSIGLALTDTEVSNLNTIVQAYQTALFRDFSRLGTYISSVEAALGSELTTTQTDAITALDTAIGSIGASKFEAVYPYLGGTAACHAIDLMGANDITWTGSATHDANGVTGGGAASGVYGDTGIVPNTSSILGQDSTHMSAYVVENPLTGSGVNMGVYDGTRFLTLQSFRGVDSIDYYYVNSGTFSNPAAESPPDGFHVVNRELSTHQDLYRRGTRDSNGAVTSTGKPQTYSIHVFGRNNSGTSDSQSDDRCGFHSIGAGLTSSEITTLTNAVNAYQTALSRAVSS